MTEDATNRPGGKRGPAARLDHRDYQLLSEFRYLIRGFLEFSEAAAARAGLTARQHQALLAIKGVPDETVTSIGYVAGRLRIQHHSAVELVDRLVASGLLMREHDPTDRRRVLLTVTATGEQRLGELSSDHLRELRRMRPALQQILDQTRPENDRDVE